MTFKQLEILFWSVGDKVTITKSVFGEADDYQPAGWYAHAGDTVIVTDVDKQARFFPYSVAHESVIDGSSFNVAVIEI